MIQQNPTMLANSTRSYNRQYYWSTSRLNKGWTSKILPLEAPEWNWSVWTATNTSNWRQWPGCTVSSNSWQLHRGSYPRTVPKCTGKLLGKVAQTTVSLWRIVGTCETSDPGPFPFQVTCKRNGVVVHRKIIWNFIGKSEWGSRSNSNFLFIPEQSIGHDSPRLDFVGNFLRDITGWWGDYAAGRLELYFSGKLDKLWRFATDLVTAFVFTGWLNNCSKYQPTKLRTGFDITDMVTALIATSELHFSSERQLRTN